MSGRWQVPPPGFFCPIFSATQMLGSNQLLSTNHPALAHGLTDRLAISKQSPSRWRRGALTRIFADRSCRVSGVSLITVVYNAFIFAGVLGKLPSMTFLTEVAAGVSS